MVHFITGGDGYVGHKIAQIILNNTSDEVILFVRANNEDQKKAKIEKIQKMFPNLDRIKIEFGDLSDSSTLQSIESSKITHIIHTAAVIRFNVEEELADKINIEGTKNVLEFAKNCSNLQKISYVSTVYATGDQAGEVTEKPYPEAKFINHYERSKNACEKLIIEEYNDLPWDIIRIATVISNSNDGEVIQYNVFHNTLRLLYNGLISILPGKEETPVYLITGDFAADSVALLHLGKASHQIYNACHTKEESATLKQIIDWVFECFEEDDEFKNKKILKPLFADQNAFNLLSSNLEALSTGVLSDALGSITPFAQQLYITKDFKNDNLRKHYVNYQAPNVEELIKNTTKYLIRTKWGRKA